MSWINDAFTRIWLKQMELGAKQARVRDRRIRLERALEGYELLSYGVERGFVVIRVVIPGTKEFHLEDADAFEAIRSEILLSVQQIESVYRLYFLDEQFQIIQIESWDEQTLITYQTEKDLFC